jgi:hypothetical protein
MQKPYCPVACCGMRMQAPPITVKYTIYVHAILTLACLCRAPRLTRPSHRLQRPSLSLPRLKRLFSYLTSPGSPLSRHQGREGLRRNQLSVGLPSHWTMYPLLLRNLRYSNTWLVCTSVLCLTRYSGDDNLQDTQGKIKYVTLPLQFFNFSDLEYFDFA